MNNAERFDVAIIGAGPAGSVAAALLHGQGFRVCVIERQHFPRFVIGESLLPYCMDILDEAGLRHLVERMPGFQYKNGAAFTWGERYTHFDFTDKFTPGPGTTFQVQRAIFDQALIDAVAARGVDVRFGAGVTRFDEQDEGVRLGIASPDGDYDLYARFVLDASGYGRVLPRLLGLDRPSSLPPRKAIFTHIDDHIVGEGFDRNKILISTHPVHRDVWSWLIPFSNGRASIGIVGAPERFDEMIDRLGDEATLRKFVGEITMLRRLLDNAVWDNGVPVRSLSNYSANVSALYGRHFALLGNAAEFLDPVFSSGVTVAMHSSRLAARLLGRQLRGETVDWQGDFVEPLMVGVNAFRTYVTGWYDASFQDVIYCDDQRVDASVRRMICSVLAGYAWDESNPFVSKSDRRLKALAELCGPASPR